MIEPTERGRGSNIRRTRVKNLLWAGFFFVLGVIGILLPIVPQVPFFIMSLLFLSLVFPSVRRALRRFLHRHPKVAHAYKKWKDRRRKKRQKHIRKRKDGTTQGRTYSNR
jgi:uncharacterized membrane protein YbaN (DUF454 family)